MSTPGLSKITPTSLALTRSITDATTGTQNDYNPTGFSEASVVQFTNSGGISLTGLLATVVGDFKVILNAGTGTVTLSNQNVSSSSANRFNFASTVTLSPNECAIIQYDGTNSCWRLVSHQYANDIQTFTSSGTWTKPAWATSIDVYLIGGGGGGGAGRWSVLSTLARGGGGGGSGAVSELTFRASALTATVAVTIGAAAAGAPAITVVSTNGANGTVGADTTFGTYMIATGGGFGVGGTASSTDIIGPQPLAGGTYSNGTQGVLSSTTGLQGAKTKTSAPYLASGLSPGSAGSGGGVAAGGNVTTAGGAGENCCYLGSNTAGGAAGTAGGGVGGAGTSGATADQPGSGGAGGGSHSGTTVAAGSGGAGALYGGGGGGGGAVTGPSGCQSGAGGAGAKGFALIISSR